MREFLSAIGALVIIALLLLLLVRTGKLARETKVVERHTREVRVVQQRSPVITIAPAQIPVSSHYTIPGPMPNELQWWEKKAITNVAKVFAKGDNLQRFHTLLGVQIEDLKICPGIGEAKCINMAGMMMMNVDRFIKKMMRTHRQPLAMAWWKDSMTAHEVAGVMPYGNLSKLHTFIGKQLRMLKGCIAPSWRAPSDPSCTNKLRKAVVRIDTYFKELVIDHGGPLIDRNWNKI